MKRIYIDQNLSEQTTVTLTGQAFLHVVKVLRFQIADNLIVFNGDGYDYFAQVDVIERKQASLTLVRHQKNKSESPLTTILLQAVSKGDRMDFAIQKAVELGVNEIFPIQTEFSAVKFDTVRQQKKKAHWQGVIVSACEQCERARLPILHDLQSLHCAVSEVTADYKWALHARVSTDEISLTPRPVAPQSFALLIGPEGGLSVQDLAIAESAGFTRQTLGSRVLRTETATISALAVVQSRWGDLGV